MDKLFKSLILISTLGYILWFFQPYNISYIYDQDTLRVLEWSGFGGNYYLLFYISYVILVLYIISAIGMLLYLKWARALFAVLTVVTILLAPFSGVGVSTSIDGFLQYIINLCDGAVLFMAYFSSISSNFKPHNKSLNQVGENDAPPG